MKFMQKLFDRGHAELALSLRVGEECWYLPNCSEVMMAFPGEDLAAGLNDLDFNNEFPPLQRSLGVRWVLWQMCLHLEFLKQSIPTPGEESS